MLSKKDRILLRHIETFKFITVKQARLIAFPDISSGYQYATRRLNKLVNIEKRLKVFYSEEMKINIYVDIDANIKKIPTSPHRVYLMNYYATLISCGAKIEKFETEKEWSNRKYRSDGICIYTFGIYRFRNLIEVNKSNNPLDLGRFDAAKDEITEACGGEVPRMIVIDTRTHKTYNTKVYEVIRLNYDLTNFSEIFL